MLSGVGREMNEADDLLTQMREARDRLQLTEAKEQIQKREREKLTAGAEPFQNAANSAAAVLRDYGRERKCFSGGEDGSSGKRGKISAAL